MSPVVSALETTIPAGGNPPGGYRKRNYLGFEIPVCILYHVLVNY